MNEINYMPTSFIFLWLVASLISGFLATWISGIKGRSKIEGFLLGFFLSALGIVIELLLPTEEVKLTSEFGASMMVDRHDRPLKKCPQCAEMILKTAKVCK